MIITTSWDDGHKLNLKLVELLDKYGLKATFYLARDYDFSQPENEIKKIAQSQEIGGHTLTHSDLLSADIDRARADIKDGKKWLENLLGQEIEVFAYPTGIYNDEVKEAVKEAGFIGARTVKCFNYQFPKDLFAWQATVHAYPHPFRRRDAKNLHLSRHLLEPISRNIFGLMKWRLPLSAYLNWPALASATFDYVKKHNGVWHLWGHSWEIEKYGMWGDLERLFQYIVGQKDILLLTNSEVIKRCQKKN